MKEKMNALSAQLEDARQQRAQALYVFPRGAAYA
jgi:hypothetical protein